jgi:hypothetical protein
MIVKANDILVKNNNPFTNGGINIYFIASSSKPGINYRLIVEDNTTYPGFKFVGCSCIGIIF